MKERERVVVTGVLSVLLLAWLGFLVHRSPRFPGSGVGAMFGIAGAVLMLVPVAYPIAKRIPFLNSRITPHVSMHSLLALHVYAGIFGPLLAIIHTGHKFDSWLGITLTAAMLLVVVSGFTVRYLLTYVGHNGDIGFVGAIDLELGEMTIAFDGRPVAYAFVSVAHLRTPIELLQRGKTQAVARPCGEQL
jgi:hypothetical protein